MKFSEFEAGVNAATSHTPTIYLDTTTYAGLPTPTSDINQSQLVSYGGITFLIQPPPNGSSTPSMTVVSRKDDTDSPSIISPGEVVSSIISPGGEVVNPSHSLSYITCVSPATIQWLIANYEVAEGVSLLKSTLYSHYLKYYNESKLSAPNFGKVIRSVFPGVRMGR